MEFAFTLSAVRRTVACVAVTHPRNLATGSALLSFSDLMEKSFVYLR